MPAPLRIQIQCGLVLVVTGLLIYANHLTHPFQFDSIQFIPDNPVLSHPDQVTRPAYVLENYFSRGGLFYTFGLNVLLGGFNTLGYHLINLALHIMNSLLVFAISLKACRYFDLPGKVGGQVPHRGVALTTALIFLCHPIQTESVVYVVSRSELLAGWFYLMAFYLFQSLLETEPASHWKSPGVWMAAIGVALCGVVGFSAKQTVATLPAVLILYYLLGCSRDSKFYRFLNLWKWALAGLAVVLGGTLLYKLLSDEAFLIGPSIAGDVIGRKNYMLTQPAVIVFYYLRLLLLPMNLNVDPDINMIRSLASFEFWAAIGILVALLVASYRIRSTRIYFFLLCWFLIVLSPSSSIVTLLDLAAEHRVYLGVFGFSLFFVLGLISLMARIFSDGPGAPMRIAGTLVLTAIVAVFGMATLERNRIWASETRLWHDAERKSPDKVRPLINLGRAYTLAGDPQRAVAYYEKSLKVDDGFFQSHYNLAVILMKQGQWDKALKHFQRAAVLDPTVADTHGRLGEMYLKMKQFRQADVHLKRAVELNPEYAEAFRNLGALHYFNLKDRAQGRVYLERSLKLNPQQQGADLIRSLLHPDTSSEAN